ncbi:MAG: hypothetical protein JXX14_24745 [Deltaproteobacteria bacterium]|nr:hypothetical protein [Deltaproteobacteria bacterium]
MFKSKRSLELHAKSGISFASFIPATLAATFVILCHVQAASAKPGSHGWAVSTWDTTRSTVVFNYEHGIMAEGGSSNLVGYNANFTSTTGRLSAQFGMQYINMNPSGMDWAMHGGAGSVIALYGIPIGQRYDNGLPKAALSLYGGAVPTVLANGQYNWVTVPFTLGLGMEISPIKHLSIIPWMEGAVSFNFDTVIRYEEFQQRVNEIVADLMNPPDPQELLDHVTITYDNNGVPIDIAFDDQALSIFLPDETIDELLNGVIEYEIAMAFRFRGGLSVVLNIGDRMDLQVNATVAQVGSDFDAPPTWFVGTALAFAWDDAPLGILPEAHRASLLSCDTVATRFESCGQYRDLIDKIRDEEAAKLNRDKTIIVHEEQKAPAKPTSPPPPPPVSTPPKSDTNAPPPAPPVEAPAPAINTPPPAVTPAPAKADVPPPPPAPARTQPPSLSQPIN